MAEKVTKNEIPNSVILRKGPVNTDLLQVYMTHVVVAVDGSNLWFIGRGVRIIAMVTRFLSLIVHPDLIPPQHIPDSNQFLTLSIQIFLIISKNKLLIKY